MASPCSRTRRLRERNLSARQGAPGGGSAPHRGSTSRAEPLAELVRRAGADGRSVFAFLMKHLLAGRPGDSAAARAYRSFARAFIDAAAERDGFVELVAAPETGGFFAQGWSRSLPSGSALVADAAEDLSLREVEVAHFARDDILPPGNGFCFFGKGWREESLAAVDAVFFESGGRLLRLDVVGETPQLAGEAATAHVVQMLPRLSADARTLDGFKRICRPRFAGVDTLYRHPGAGRGRSRHAAAGTRRRAAGDRLAARPAAPGGAGADQEHGQPLRAARRRLVPAAPARPRPRLRSGPALRQPPRRDRRDARLRRPRPGLPRAGGRRRGLSGDRPRGGRLPVPPARGHAIREPVAPAATSCSPSHRTSRSSPRSCATILRRSCAASGRPGARSHGRRVARSPSAAAAASGRPQR